MKKIAVVLFNLGGPDSPKAVKPFLFNLFSDPAIIRLPFLLRKAVAWLISSRREKTAQEIYGKIGGSSPILANTEAQAVALQKSLSTRLGSGVETKIFIAMRYWHPFTEEALREVQKFQPDEIVLLPLYPQFSTTTTASSLSAWKRRAKKQGVHVPMKTLCCYPKNPGFIEALATQTLDAYKKAQTFGIPRILFSAHGLPEKIVKAGDPYAWQCEQTAQALAKAINIDNLDWNLCYQSRVGPLKWIGPSTDEEIKRAGRDKRPLVIVPIAFVSEHSETLVEIDIEYRHLAQEQGVPHYIYVPTVSVAPSFIKGLADLVHQVLNSDVECQSNAGARFCPPEMGGCCFGSLSNKEANHAL